jgi:photosystem II stability/assembly factor-like uncharacterized protein
MASLLSFARQVETTTFRPVKLGGGGFVASVEISPDGLTRIAKTDVYDAYRWANPDDLSATDSSGMDAAFQWCHLTTRQSMPSDERGIKYSGGYSCYEIAYAPSNSARLYSVFTLRRGLDYWFYVSSDRGMSWTRRTLPTGDWSVAVDGNPYRLMGPKMAVDPVDPDTVYVCDVDGNTFFTRDAGQNWTTVSTSELPLGSPGHIAIDPSSSTVSGRKSRVYAATGSNGIYVSDDSGVNWSFMTGSPEYLVRCLRVDALGRIWLTNSNGTQNCYRYASGTWTRMSCSHSESFQSIDVNPLNTSHICAQGIPAQLSFSSDNGDTWTTIPGGTVPARLTTDIPWLAAAMEDYLTSAMSRYDPVTNGRFWAATGIGIYYTDEVPSTNETWPEWTELTRGNDELIGSQCVKPPGRPLFSTFWDRALHRFDDIDEYPTVHYPFMDVGIRHGWSVDYAKNDPDFMAVITNGGNADKSAYSTDGGDTWTEFASKPSTDFNFGGTIAVSTPTNMCWFPANNGTPHYTTDGGASWSVCSIPGVATSGEQGWSFATYTNRIIVSADHVTAGKFYAFNYGGDAGYTVEGFYRSTDGGANWTRRGPGPASAISSMGTGSVIKCVPGKEDHFFWTCGLTDGETHPYDPDSIEKTLLFSDDGGLNTYRATGFTEVWSIGYGKEKPGGTYPTLFVAGQRSGDTDPGIYRCNDWNPTTRSGTWTRLAEDYCNLDVIASITGDMDTYGRVYAVRGSAGVIVGDID